MKCYDVCNLLSNGSTKKIYVGRGGGRFGKALTLVNLEEGVNVLCAFIILVFQIYIGLKFFKIKE